MKYYYKVYYYSGLWGVICVEDFNSLEEAKQWIEGQENRDSDFEFMEIQKFNKNGCWCENVEYITKRQKQYEI